MKQITLTGILMPAILILLQACAGGKVNNGNYRDHSSGGPPDMIPEATGNMVYRNEINTKAVRHFKKTYPGADNERWYTIQDGYMAKYRMDDTDIRLDYDRYGNWLYTIRYINEKKLPREVRTLVKSTWFDYAIASVEEIQFGEQFIYIVHIHEGEDWKLIRVMDGEMSELIPPGKVGYKKTL